MTVKIELHAASTKHRDKYSPELCALSFMICLTGWESVLCKVSLLKCIWSSKARTVTLYTEASIYCGLRSAPPLLEAAALMALYLSDIVAPKIAPRT